jgi:hypothetical protein
MHRPHLSQPAFISNKKGLKSTIKQKQLLHLPIETPLIMQIILPLFIAFVTISVRANYKSYQEEMKARNISDKP